MAGRRPRRMKARGRMRATSPETSHPANGRDVLVTGPTPVSSVQGATKLRPRGIRMGELAVGGVALGAMALLALLFGAEPTSL